MKKKIICLGILSMILLTGLTTVSGTKIETSDNNITDDEIKTSLQDDPPIRIWSIAFIDGQFNIESVRYGRIGNTNLLKNVEIEGYAEVYPQIFLNFNIGLFYSTYYNNDPHLLIKARLLIDPPELTEGTLVEFGPCRGIFEGTLGIGITAIVLE